MVTPLSKIKKFNEESSKTFICTLYSNGTMYIPKAMGGIDVDSYFYFSEKTRDFLPRIVLHKGNFYKPEIAPNLYRKHVYIIQGVTRQFFRDEGHPKKIQMRFIDVGPYYELENWVAVF